MITRYGNCSITCHVSRVPASLPVTCSISSLARSRPSGGHTRTCRLGSRDTNESDRYFARVFTIFGEISSGLSSVSHCHMKGGNQPPGVLSLYNRAHTHTGEGMELDMAAFCSTCRGAEQGQWTVHPVK